MLYNLYEFNINFNLLVLILRFVLYRWYKLFWIFLSILYMKKEWIMEKKLQIKNLGKKINWKKLINDYMDKFDIHWFSTFKSRTKPILAGSLKYETKLNK